MQREKPSAILEDVVEMTQKVFGKFIAKTKPLPSAVRVYDTSKALQKVIKHTDLVANHYLASSFEEPFLQNSSCGAPIDKWRFVLNRDLEKLNESSKKYLLVLSSLRNERMHGFDNFLSELYRTKIFHSYVSEAYYIGKVKPPTQLFARILNLECKDADNDIKKEIKIDLSTY